MLDALAFLPVDQVIDGMQALREAAPDGTTRLVDYFDSTYVSGSYRSVMTSQGHMRFRRKAPSFEPSTLNVRESTLLDQQRTNNMCESWNNAFKHLVGHSLPSLWTVLNCLQKDAAMVQTKILKHDMRQPEPKRKRKQTIIHQNRVKAICQQFDKGEKTMAQFLYAMSQCIRHN
jgi:hypothetical protein